MVLCSRYDFRAHDVLSVVSFWLAPQPRNYEDITSVIKDKARYPTPVRPLGALRCGHTSRYNTFISRVSV